MHTKGFIAGLLLTAITLSAGLSWAAGLEIITPPLLGGLTTCLVTNVSPEPVADVAYEVLGAHGEFLYGAGADGLPPLWTSRAGGSGGSICRVTSETAKKGDLKATFCVTGGDGGLACVTAE